MPDSCKIKAVEENNILEAKGNWKNDEKYGWQFAAESIKEITDEEMINYFEAVDEYIQENGENSDEDVPEDYEKEIDVDEIVEEIIQGVDYQIFHLCRESGSDLHTTLDEIVESAEDYLEGGWDNPDKSTEVITKVCEIVIRNFFSGSWTLRSDNNK